MFASKRIWQCLGGLVVLGGFVVTLAAQTPAGTPAAVVNGEPISMDDVNHVMEVEGMKPKEALEDLIDETLVRQFLRKTVPAATPADVEKELIALTKKLELEKITPADYLAKTKQTAAQLRADIAAQLMWKSYVKVRLTDAICKKYFDDNRLFFDQAKCRASHVLVKAKQDAPAAEKQAAYNKIQAIHQELTAGKIEFPEAARKYSECPSKDAGGDIGYFRYKFDVAEPFARTAFGMKINEMSSIVVTHFGYHIIKVTDRTKGEPADFEKIKEDVRTVYAEELGLYHAVVEEGKKTARIEINMK